MCWEQEERDCHVLVVACSRRYVHSGQYTTVANSKIFNFLKMVAGVKIYQPLKHAMWPWKPRVGADALGICTGAGTNTGLQGLQGAGVLGLTLSESMTPLASPLPSGSSSVATLRQE